MWIGVDEKSAKLFLVTTEVNIFSNRSDWMSLGRKIELNKNYGKVFFYGRLSKYGLIWQEALLIKDL